MRHRHSGWRAARGRLRVRSLLAARVMRTVPAMEQKMALGIGLAIIVGCALIMLTGCGAMGPALAGIP
jgi:hypothetical protein